MPPGGFVPTGALLALLDAIAAGRVSRHYKGRGHTDRYDDGTDVPVVTMNRATGTGLATPDPDAPDAAVRAIVLTRQGQVTVAGVHALLAEARRGEGGV